MVVLVTKTKAPAEPEQPTEKQEQRLADVANPPAPEAGSVIVPAVRQDESGRRDVAHVVFTDAKGRETSIEVPSDHLRNLARECERVCQELCV